MYLGCGGATRPASISLAMATSEAGKGAEQACAAAAAATDGDDGGERPPRMIQMPQEYVDWVLAQKREAYYESPEDYPLLRTNNPVKVDGLSEEWVEKNSKSVIKTAVLLKKADDSFEEFQKQVRKEVEKGYYEVGMDFFVQRAASRALFDEQWAKIDFTGIDVEEDDDDE